MTTPLNPAGENAPTLPTLIKDGPDLSLLGWHS